MTAHRSDPEKRRYRKDGPRERPEVFLERFPARSSRARALFTGYPSTYSVGMSNLGFHFIYGEASRDGRFRVERFFTDTSPLTLESRTPISAAFALMFTVSYEEDHINLVRTLIEAGIEPRRSERKGRPLIVAGGPAVSANPFPLEEILDIAVLGEGEGTIGVLLDALFEAPQGDPPGCLDALEGEKGIFICGRRGGPQAACSQGRKMDSFPHSVVMSGDTVFPWTMLIEAGRGCPGSCSFCLATSLYRPFRFMPLDSMLSLIDGAEAVPPRVGLVSTAVTAHPSFIEMMEALAGRDIGVGLSSISADTVDRQVADAIAGAGVRSVSLAPETGDEVLRARLGKSVPDDIFVEAVSSLSSAGIERLSVYLLTGIPGEEEGTAAVTERFLARMVEAGKGIRFSAHINVMVPKPWTPLQFFPMAPEKELRDRARALGEAASRAGMRPQLKPVRNSIRQAQLSLGGSGLGEALIAYAMGGISWKKAVSEAGAGPPLTEERAIEDPPPWYGVEGPARHEVLLARYRRISG